MVSAGPGSPPDLAVRADIEIPERRITLSLVIRRDLNQVQQATSHTIEITFNLPADFPFGGIQNVPGVLMKQAEQTRGSPLGGATAKVTSDYFLIGLSAVETDMQRNVQLLKERSWLDIPIVYNNGRVSIRCPAPGTFAPQAPASSGGYCRKGNPSEREVKRPTTTASQSQDLMPPGWPTFSPISPTSSGTVGLGLVRDLASERAPNGSTRVAGLQRFRRIDLGLSHLLAFKPQRPTKTNPEARNLKTEP